MKKFKYILFFVLLLNLIFIPQVNADTCGKIRGIYSYDDEKLENANVDLYLIAEYNNATNNYSFTNDFKDYSLDINSLNYGELEEYSKTLKNFISKNNIASFISIKTDSDGTFTFDNCLKNGLYLINVVDIKKDDKIYQALPSILTVPTISKEDGTEIYDITINLKSEVKEATDDKNTNDSNKNSGIKIPNTYDSIIIYVSVFIVSLLLLVILICYINFKKKGSKKDEKN